MFNVFRTIKVDKLLSKLLQQPDIYADFEFLAFWQTQYNNMNAVNLFFAWIKVKNQLNRVPDHHVHIHSFRASLSYNSLSYHFLMFWSSLQIFKYISFNKTMTQLSSTLGRCAKDILGFAVMFFIVFFAYAQLGYLLFGTEVDSFSTFVKCM